MGNVCIAGLELLEGRVQISLSKAESSKERKPVLRKVLYQRCLSRRQ